MSVFGRLRNLWNLSKEHRSSDWSGGFFDLLNFANSSEEVVNERTAMRVATVSACMKILGEDIAALPKSVMKRDGAKRVQEKSRLNYLISTKPNKYMTAYNWTFSMVVGAAGYGESYAPILKDRNGDVQSIEIIPPWQMTRVRMPDGSIYFSHLGKVYNTDDVITLRPFSFDGINPVSIIKYNAETIGFALKSQKYRSKVFSVKPPGYLSSELPLNGKEQEEKVAKNWKTQSTGGTPVLYGGLKYHPLSFSPADLQLLDASKATKEDICALFRMPPTFIQDYSRATFSNAEQQAIVYKTYTLIPFITNMMQEIDSKVFPESNQMSEKPSYTNFNLNGLLMGDFKTRIEGYRTLWQMGVPVNRFLALEDQDPVEGGDKGFIPMNMIATDKTDEFYNKLITSTSAKEKASSEEQRDFMNNLEKLIKMNGYSHQEHV